LGVAQDILRAPDTRARGVVAAERDALAARHTRGRAAPECVGLCAGHRQHEADGRAALHTIDQHVAQSFDLALPDRLKTTDPNGVRHVHLLDARDRSVAITTMYRAGLRVRLRNAVGSLSCMARQSSSARRYVTLPIVTAMVTSRTQICW